MLIIDSSELDKMPKKFKGRQRGMKNHPRVALPLMDALQELDSRAAQTMPMTAKILGVTEGAVRREAHKWGAFQMGRLWFVPSVVIRQRILPDRVADREYLLPLGLNDVGGDRRQWAQVHAMRAF
jgi:hypothetical protein